MHWQRLIPFAPLIAALFIAAWVDVRHRRIPNWLTLPLLAGGLLQAISPAGTVGPMASLLGLAVGGGLSLPMFILGVRGGGDVKLLAAVGAWIGPAGALLVLLAAALVGMCLVLAQCVIQGRLMRLLGRTVLVALSLRHVRLVGAEAAAYSLTHERAVDKPLPYATPVLGAVFLVLWWRVLS